MADASYQPKVYRKQGGAIQVIADGGELALESGGTLTHESGSLEISENGVGAKNGSTVTVVEHGNAVVHRTVFTCTATPITMADEAGVIQHGGVKLYDFPAGLLMTLGAVIDGSVTTPVHDDASGGTIATWDGDIGLGTVVASNNNSLAATEQNILQTTATTQAVAQVANVDAVSACTLLTESAASWIDGTGTNPDLYLNLLIDDSANNDAHTALFTGTVTVTWINLGDK